MNQGFPYAWNEVKTNSVSLSVYLETGSTGTAGTFTITTSITAATARSYKIKVSYILCSSTSK